MTNSVPHRLGAQASNRQSLDAVLIASPFVTPRKKPLEVKVGSVGIRIYLTRWTDPKRRRTYASHTIAWRDATGRHREKRNSLAAAKTRAEEIATRISNGELSLGAMSNADKVRTVDWNERAHKLGVSPQQVFDRGEQEIKADRTRTQIVRKPCPEIVEEFFEKRRMGGKWKRILGKMLERFAKWHPGPLVEMTGRALDDWLDTLKFGLRSRMNYRNAIQSLVEFAKTRGYAAKEFNPFEEVSNPVPPAASVNLYTPEELIKLLTIAESSAAGRKLVPLICITAFCGIRHGEMNEEKIEALDWSDVDLKHRSIYVQIGAAKTGKDRTVEIPENLAAWLAPYVRPRGKICELSNTSSAICRLRKKAGITGRKKNGLRKSFISYRLALSRNIEAVADGAGNSAAVIRKNYKRSDFLQETAARWFTIFPARADNLPLFDWGREAVTKQSPTANGVTKPL